MKQWQAWVRGHRILASTAIAGPLLLFTHPTPLSMLWGLPLVALGAAARTWSSGHIRKDGAVAVDGPYAWTRNPLYLGNFLLGLGVALMGRSFPLLIFYLITFYAVYKPTITGEEEKLRQKFGRVYLTYLRQTPRFFPSLMRKPPPSTPSGPQFDWKRVMGHREYRTWLGILGVLILLALRTVFT